MKKVCLIGSTRHKDMFLQVAEGIQLAGKYDVLMTHVFSKFMKRSLTEKEIETLHEMSRERMMEAELVIVINPDGYIGEDTQKEIEFARSINKPVYYMVVSNHTQEWYNALFTDYPSSLDD